MKEDPNVILVCKECSENMFPNKGTFDVQVGDFTKLKFADDSALGAEYMWVEVTKADKDNNKYEGRIDNDPIVVKSVRFNDIIKFQKEDILQAQ